MNIKDKALYFAIKAHNGQIRKSDPEKPMITHPIYVGYLLNFYGFDDNVVAAGYLHDVIEDTKYTSNDISELFGEDIASLVISASESDKSKSWEERKQETINNAKNLDLRHKAVVTCDKISNVGDMAILFDRLGTKDYSAFKRGFKDQKWYYEGVCNSLTEKENHEMFNHLKSYVNVVYKDISLNINYKEMEIEILHTIKDILTDFMVRNNIEYKEQEEINERNPLISSIKYLLETINNKVD